jgi:hypothetical protein
MAAIAHVLCSHQHRFPHHITMQPAVECISALILHVCLDLFAPPSDPSMPIISLLTNVTKPKRSGKLFMFQIYLGIMVDYLQMQTEDIFWGGKNTTN